MTRETKTKNATPVEAPAFDDTADAATESALAVPAQSFVAASDPHAEPTDLDPGGDIQTDFRTAVVGRPIVITRWGLSPAAEQYANANPYGLFAVLGFYFADDTEHKARFATTGATRIVETVQQSIVNGTKLPVRATVTSFTTRGGTGYRFARPGEQISR